MHKKTRLFEYIISLATSYLEFGNSRHTTYEFVHLHAKNVVFLGNKMFENDCIFIT
jgi:hypothetical protein